MTAVYHSVLNLKVNRLLTEDLMTECSLLSSDQEAHAWMLTGAKDLRIRRASWAVYRSPSGVVPAAELPDLIGLVAYLESGPRLKQILGHQAPNLAGRLFAECIRGLIQAETFFYQERGFGSPTEYDAHWDAVYYNACLYYSHLGQIEQSWMEYASDDRRRGNLFNRTHSIAIDQNAELGHELTAVFIDSFHELSLHLNLDPQGRVSSVEARFLRAPDKICGNSARHLEKFRGKKLAQLSKKEIAGWAGGAAGCNHLVDLINECSQVVRYLSVEN